MLVNNEALSVLLRVAAELIYRSYCTKHYLDRISSGEVGEYLQLIETIRTALQKSEDELRVALRGIKEKEIVAGDALNVLFNSLAIFSRSFARIHELLIYLPRQHVHPETVTTVITSFGDYYRERKPAIIIGSLFNALEYDFSKILRHYVPDIKEIDLGEKESIVLQLAICDRDSPPAWGVLAHEMGHAIDLHRGISKSVTAQFVTDPDSASIIEAWSREICADLIATEALGPSALLAILSLEYCFYPGGAMPIPTETHPATTWRFDIVTDYLSKKYGDLDFLNHERQFFSIAAEYYWQRKPLMLPNKIIVDQQYNYLVKLLAEKLGGEVLQLNLSKETIEKQSLERCRVRLSRGSPISAQGLEREVLRKSLNAYKAQTFSSDDARENAFKKLTSSFVEKPLGIQTILMSCYSRRLEIINELIKSDGLAAADDKVINKVINDYCEKLSALDELTISSINTSAVHQRLLKKRNEGSTRFNLDNEGFRL
jgi:hypothetical protein